MARAKRLFRGRRDKHEVEAPDAPLAEASGGDRLFDLLMTQRADGSFVTSPLLESWLGPERSARLAAACREHGEPLAVTLTVLALLAKEEPARASEWQPAALKARAFCAGKAGQLDVTAIVSA